jgi:hypothetical protein
LQLALGAQDLAPWATGQMMPGIKFEATRGNDLPRLWLGLGGDDRFDVSNTLA